MTFDSSDADSWFLRNSTFLKTAEASSSILAINQFLNFDSRPINSILEVGCGNGYKLSYLCEKYNSAGTGIDLSPLAIAEAKKGRNKNIKYLIGDIQSPELDSIKFDLIYLGFFLYLIPPWERIAIYQRVSELLSASGKLVIEDFDVIKGQIVITPYHHRKEIMTYKSDIVQEVADTIQMTLVFKQTYSESGFYNETRVNRRLALQIFQAANC